MGTFNFRNFRVVIATLLIAGCASQPPMRNTYEQLGGQQGIQGIVDDLLEVIVEDERINFQFAKTDIARFHQKLSEQICVESGGPCTYTGLSMKESHAGRDIDNVQFNALVEDLIKVMERRRIPVTAQNRLLKRLAPMHADIVEKNKSAKTMPKPESN